MLLVGAEVIFSVSLMRRSNVTETKKKSAEIVVAGCWNNCHSWTRGSFITNEKEMLRFATAPDLMVEFRPCPFD